MDWFGGLREWELEPHFDSTQFSIFKSPLAYANCASALVGPCSPLAPATWYCTYSTCLVRRHLVLTCGWTTFLSHQIKLHCSADSMISRHILLLSSWRTLTSQSLKIDVLPLKPTGIAIDHRDNRVYYVDLLNRDHILISMNMDGSDRQKLYQVRFQCYRVSVFQLFISASTYSLFYHGS